MTWKLVAITPSSRTTNPVPRPPSYPLRSTLSITTTEGFIKVTRFLKSLASRFANSSSDSWVELLSDSFPSEVATPVKNKNTEIHRVINKFTLTFVPTRNEKSRFLTKRVRRGWRFGTIIWVRPVNTAEEVYRLWFFVDQPSAWNLSNPFVLSLAGFELPWARFLFPAESWGHSLFF